MFAARLLLALGTAAAPAMAAPPSATDLLLDRGQTGGSGEDEAELPAPFDRLAEAVNPARLQRRLDERRGREVERSSKPRAPELPLALFVESIRPLGGLKYENQLNYLAAGFTGDAPTFQTVAYEYVFADWHAARVEAVAPGGRLESVSAGYQQTFGVGPRGNWVHGGLVQPEWAVTGSGFVGGSAFYTLAWKPDRGSPWTVTGSAGANRAAVANSTLGGTVGGVGSMGQRLPRERPEGRAEADARVWRPFGAVNLFYTLSPRVTVGAEVDAFAHCRFGEYLVLPNLTWRPTEHFFIQLGTGWYEVGGDSQAALMCRVNLLQPSPRTARAE